MTVKESGYLAEAKIKKVVITNNPIAQTRKTISKKKRLTLPFFSFQPVLLID